MYDLSKIIGNNIKTLRKGSSLSQGNLANFLGVDQSFISKIEKGERTIASDMLEKIAELFGVTLEEITDENMKNKGIVFAFRADEICDEDLEVIQCINKMVLNFNTINNLIKEEEF